MAAVTLLPDDGWTLLKDTAGRWQVDLGSQGPVWVSGVVTSKPAAADLSTYVLKQGGDGILTFTLESGDKLYGRTHPDGVSQSIAVDAAAADTQTDVEALAALIGDPDDADDADTVFGRLNKIITNTTP